MAVGGIVSRSVMHSDGMMPPGVLLSGKTHKKKWCLRPLLKAGRVGVDERWIGIEFEIFGATDENDLEVAMEVLREGTHIDKDEESLITFGMLICIILASGTLKSYKLSASLQSQLFYLFYSFFNLQIKNLHRK